MRISLAMLHGNLATFTEQDGFWTDVSQHDGFWFFFLRGEVGSYGFAMWSVDFGRQFCNFEVVFQ